MNILKELWKLETHCESQITKLRTEQSGYGINFAHYSFHEKFYVKISVNPKQTL